MSNFLICNISTDDRRPTRINFINTVENAVSFFVDDEIFQGNYWGLRDTGTNINRDKFNNLKVDDEILFYNNKDGIFKKAKVREKITNKSDIFLDKLSLNLWGAEDFHFAFSLKDIEDVFISAKTCIEKDAVAKGTGVLQSALLVERYFSNGDLNPKWETLSELLDNSNGGIVNDDNGTGEYLSEKISNLEYQSLNLKKFKERFNKYKILDQKVESTRRVEQAELRNMVIDNYCDRRTNSFICAICLKKLPLDLMVTAHMIPRSNLENVDRISKTVALPICSLGCDRLYELGYLKFDLEAKKVVASKKTYDSGKNLMKFVEDNVAAIYDESQEQKKNPYLENKDIIKDLSDLKDKYELIFDINL